MAGTIQHHDPARSTRPDSSRTSNTHRPASRRRPLWESLATRSDATELLDGGAHEVQELLENHRDMGRVNRWLAGAAVTIRGIQRLTGRLRPGSDLTVVDIGTGLADIPRAVVSWGCPQGVRVTAIAIDIDLQALRASRLDRRNDSIRFAIADACRIPLSDGSVDIAISSMTLHHLDDANAIASLCEMARVARLGIVVNDLTRSLHGLIGAWVLSRLTTRNRLTRHDAPLSVRRARTTEELAELARAAGLPDPVFDGALGYRVAMTIGTRPW